MENTESRNRDKSPTRLQKRAYRSLLAKVRVHGKDIHAFVQDVSKSGIGITCNHDLAIGDTLDITMSFPEMEHVSLHGALIRKRNLPIIAQHKYFLGIRLDDPPEEYSRFVESTLRSEYKRRVFERFHEVLEVEIKDILGLMNAKTENVSIKGLFIRTETPLQVGAEYDVAFTSKKLDRTLNCLVETITSFECRHGDLKLPHGAGVKIISFAGDDDKYFVEFLKNLDDLSWYRSPEELHEKGRA